jgi:hypothetical protein
MSAHRAGYCKSQILIPHLSFFDNIWANVCMVALLILKLSIYNFLKI